MINDSAVVERIDIIGKMKTNDYITRLSPTSAPTKPRNGEP